MYSLVSQRAFCKAVARAECKNTISRLAVYRYGGLAVYSLVPTGDAPASIMQSCRAESPPLFMHCCMLSRAWPCTARAGWPCTRVFLLSYSQLIMHCVGPSFRAARPYQKLQSPVDPKNRGAAKPASAEIVLGPCGLLPCTACF